MVKRGCFNCKFSKLVKRNLEKLNFFECDKDDVFYHAGFYKCKYWRERKDEDKEK